MKQMLFILFAAAGFSVSSCNFSNERVSGNRIISTEDRKTGSFNGISVHGSMDVYVAEAAAESVTIEAEENILPYLETKVEGGELKIAFRNNTNISTHEDVKVYVKAPRFDNLELFGSGSLLGESLLKNNSGIKISSSGSGEINLEVDAPVVTVGSNGSGEITLAGRTRDLQYKSNGSGDADLERLKAENVTVTTNGSASLAVFASTTLNVRSNGSGDVTYLGNPAITNKSFGSGTVRKKD